MTQDELKQSVAREAIKYIVDGEVIGVGSGSTANCFIDELGAITSDFDPEGMRVMIQALADRGA